MSIVSRILWLLLPVIGELLSHLKNLMCHKITCSSVISSYENICLIGLPQQKLSDLVWTSARVVYPDWNLSIQYICNVRISQYFILHLSQFIINNHLSVSHLVLPCQLTDSAASLSTGNFKYQNVRNVIVRKAFIDKHNLKTLLINYSRLNSVCTHYFLT
jgi:hypothetical protein